MIRFGVLGLGHIGKRHAQSVLGHASAELVSIADVRSKEECDAVQFEDVIWYDSMGEMLESGGLDVVCVCTPNGLHAEQAIEIMRNGCDVVLEKPIALSVKDAQAIKQVSEETSRNVFCVMQNRYAPPSVWLKEMVDSGKLGRLAGAYPMLVNRDDMYYAKGSWRGTLALDGGRFSHSSHISWM